MIAQIVHVRAVDHVRLALLSRERAQPREQLFLAEVAAVGRVEGVLRIVQLTGLDDPVGKPEERGEPARLLELGRRIRLGVRGHQHGVVTHRVLGRAGEKRRVDATGERDEDAPHFAEDAHQPFVLGFERRVRHGALYPITGPARPARGTMGRAPTWEMISAAASAPRRPQVARSKPRLKPYNTPDA